MTTINLFSGADGWGEGAKPLGLSPVGLELDSAACATAKAAGHHTIRTDVTTFCAKHLWGGVRGVIASPPCTDFSAAGRREGLDGPTGRLVYEVARVVSECQPEWIACEQVKEVLPIWRQFCDEFATMGYSTWCGVLDAADYGVPQNRLRAILIASRTHKVQPPPATHAKDPHPDFFGRQLDRWVSMADGLGWGMTERPAFTITAKDSGGIELAPGGSGQRRSLKREDGSTQTREIDRPAPTVTGANAQWVWERPATTVMGDQRIFPPDGHHPYQGLGSWSSRAIKVSHDDLAALQSFPADYPFQGNASERSRQIGNAIPPLLASHILAEATGQSISLINRSTSERFPGTKSPITQGADDAI